MKVDTDGILRHLLNFGSLSSGDTFVYRDEVYLCSGSCGVKLETGHILNLDADCTVHKVNLVCSTGEESKTKDLRSK